MATTMDLSNTCFSSDLPYTIFSADLNQYSLHDLSEDNKKFLWHQFMLDVLLKIPRSLTSNEDIIEACSRLANDNDPQERISMTKAHIDDFRSNYTSDNAINWYTRASFVFSVFNKACRTLNSDAIIPFHPVVKDLTNQLKQLHKQQKQDGKITFPLTVYRGQTHLGKGELEKLQKNVDGLISMNTFLSTSTDYNVAKIFIEDVKGKIPVLFQITVNESKNKEKSQIFALINQYSNIQGEGEVLFGMSSVFKIIAVEDWPHLWNVELELTNCEDDKNVQRFMNEIKSYLYQISGKQTPFIVFKQFFTTTSLSRVRPFYEFLKYFLIDLTELFVKNVYNKKGQLKELIDMEYDLYILVTKTNSDNIHSNQRIIYLLFDLLNQFYYYKKKNVQKEEEEEEEEISFDKTDDLSLFCFGGFLLLTGECDKANEYFNILLKNTSINEQFKSSIHSMLGASYVMMKNKQSALESFQNALKSFESSMGPSTPPWLATSIASSYITQSDFSQIPDILQPFINEEHSDNDVHEKIRLIHRGHIYSEDNKFIQAINHWEAALEITSYLPSSLVNMLNGAIYMQIACAYLRLNNPSKALNTMEKAKQSLESYYPSTHRLFGGFYLTYGYYLLQNDKSSQAISCFKKALENTYFINDKEFRGIIYALLIMACIHQGDLNTAEKYCWEANPYILPNSISSQIPILLEEIPEMKLIIQYENPNYGRQMIRKGLRIGNKLMSVILPKNDIILQNIDEDNSTVDQLINIADYYRQKNDYQNADIFFKKALDKITENDSKYLWNIYKKLIRMNINDQYEDYFSILYSKFNDENIKHFQIISTLQIIISKLNLSKNEFDLAFNCLIYGIFMEMKFLFIQYHTEYNYIYDLFISFINREEIIKIIIILTKLIEIYFINYSKYLEEFFLKYFSLNNLYENLSQIIHHEQIDNIINQIQFKPLSLFLNTLLKLFRQSISLQDKSIVSIKEQILEFLHQYNHLNQPLFYLMKIFESFILNDTQRFFYNLEQFRLNTITLENYQKFKEIFSKIFQQLDEQSLFTFLQNIPINLSN